MMFDAQWDRVRGRLRDEFGEAAFKSWLKPLMLREVRDDSVRISVPTRFLRDWVITHYGERIRTLWSGENAKIRNVEIVVQAAAGERRAAMAAATPVAPAPVAPPVETAPSIDEISAPLTRASPLTTSWSANPTSSPTRRPVVSPRPSR